MASQQKFTLTVPEGYDEDSRRTIGEEAIKVIIARSKAGKDKNGSKFAGYSASYIDSFDFKLGGKSKGNVNLTLSNEMLNSLEIIETSKGEIVIGIPKDDILNNAKAEGNILGTYGQKSPIRGKARDFMGLSSKEKESILSKIPIKDKEEDSDLFGDLLRSTASVSLADRFFPPTPGGSDEF